MKGEEIRASFSGKKAISVAIAGVCNRVNMIGRADIRIKGIPALQYIVL
jgi:hypothetical protein